MCHVVLTPKYGGVRARLDSQAKYKGSPCCLGCKRFISFAKTKKERGYITTYLLTGHIPSHDLPPTLSVQEVLRRLKARYHQIRSRYNHKVTENKNCPLTLNDLIRIYIKQDQLCQITGFRCYLHDTSLPRQPYWALSLDHIVPVSHQLNNHYVWSADNLQVMSTILNSIKGDANDVEIVDWYKRFLAANMVLID
ncbi:hypothetical protein A0J61_06654 [Choanephora cucurbitarum]|uniref:Uncharacterized protein n=1 Tax=Choanephora cucurbitarum TaxID=101091 RepID=A0A1C7ND45_9FUNG|nr:hypothetical protein A0J61_06654 [Choanephora cucurbitarum]